MGERNRIESYGGIFVTTDLRLCLEGAMHVALDEAVQRNWYTQEEADAEFEVWDRQFKKE